MKKLLKATLVTLIAVFALLGASVTAYAAVTYGDKWVKIETLEGME